MSESLEDRIFSEQVRLLYRGKVRTIILNYIAVLIATPVLYKKVTLLPLVVWLILVVVVATWRLKTAISEAPYDEPFEDPFGKMLEFMFSSSIQGLIWGVGLAYFILQVPLLYQAMIYILLSVIVAMCLVSYSTSLLAYLVFVLTTTVLPVVVVMFLGDGLEAGLASLMLIAIIVITNGFIWNYNRLKRGMRLRFEKDDLMESLVESNRKLEQSNQQLETLKHQLTAASLTDELTGIPNRRYFNNQLNSEWHRAMRDRLPLSCIMLDIDHFKLYNDNYGHLKGDECLKTVAQTINSNLKRPADFVARYGGEEFVVLLPDTSMDGAIAIANNIREGINNMKIQHEFTNTGILTLSQGVACLVPEKGENEKSLTRLADQALYEAKSDGRDRIRPAVTG